MRALFVAPYLPTPGSGGRTRLVSFMDLLARVHEVRLVAFAAPDQTVEDSPYPGVALPTPPKRKRPGGLEGVVRFYAERLLDPLPTYASWNRSPAMAGAIRSEIERFRPDVVQVETSEMAQYLRAVPAGVPTALDLQDVASRWFGRAVQQTRGAKERALLTADLLKTKRYENNAARRAGVVFVCSEQERDFLRARSGVEPVVVENGVDTRAFVPRSDIAEDPDKILFVGPLTYIANLDGMQWFSREVLPLIVARRPSARVEVAGVPVEESFGEQVRLLGRVDDVRTHLAEAPVSVVPVRLGSGTRYKILEALSMERAVVSTTVGAEGLGVRDREHLLIADEPRAFADAVLELMGDPALRARLGAAGRAHVAARYDWEPLVARVSASWERLVANTSQE